MKKKTPDQLGIKIGTPKQVVWQRVLDNCKTAMASAQEDIMIQREFVKVAERIIEEEKKKLK